MANNSRQSKKNISIGSVIAAFILAFLYFFNELQSGPIDESTQTPVLEQAELQQETSSPTEESNLPFVDDPFESDGTLKESVRYKTGEYEYFYETDEEGRIVLFETDDLQLTTREERLPHDGNTPGKIKGDHAGHLAGDRFGGSPHIDNLVSQSAKVNLSTYKKMENAWASALEDGKEVTVEVEVIYTDDDMRPDEFDVEYTIDGEYFTQHLLN